MLVMTLMLITVLTDDAGGCNYCYDDDYHLVLIMLIMIMHMTMSLIMIWW